VTGLFVFSVKVIISQLLFETTQTRARAQTHTHKTTHTHARTNAHTNGDTNLGQITYVQRDPLADRYCRHRRAVTIPPTAPSLNRTRQRNEHDYGVRGLVVRTS
jgi:hypothetical protein